MHNIFICNTYMQLFTAIQSSRTLFKDDECDLIITDDPQNSEVVAERLGKEGVFSRIAYVKCRDMDFDPKSKLNQYSGAIRFYFGNRSEYRNQLWDDSTQYERMFYSNLQKLCFFIVEESEKEGVTPKGINMDEGILGYKAIGNMRGTNTRFARTMRRLRGRHDFSKDGNCVVFYPDILSMISDQNMEVECIPPINNDEEFSNIILRIFDIDTSKDLLGNYKYVYFGLNGNTDLGETEIVERLAEHIGKDNLLVKQHPGDHRGYFESRGFHIMDNSYVPWEAYLAAYDFSEKIFISINSTSLLNSSMMFNSGAKSYYLYPCIDNEKLQKAPYIVKTLEVFEFIKNMGYCNDIEAIDAVDKVPIV